MMKKAIKIFGTTLLVVVLFRGLIFRSLIEYQEIGTRSLIELMDERLIEKIKAKSNKSLLGISKIVKIADSVTRQELSFTFKKASCNPNELIETKKANCIGYSAMFNSIASYLIIKNNLQTEFSAEHLVGKIDFFGLDMHQYFDDPFYKDHDFNIIKNLKTGVELIIDPTVSDYLWIDRVTLNK